MSQPSIDLIRAERYRQQQSEGYDQEQDRGRAHELALAGAAYAELAATRLMFPAYEGDETPESWPWRPEYWKPKNTERDLVRAGALIVAALDSLRSNNE